MLTIIDRYILKKYLSTFGLMLLLFVPIGIMLNLAEQIGKMIDNEAPLVEILVYYGNFTIYIGSLLFPIFLFLSIIFFTSKMANNTEIVAILSSGVSFGRFLRPYWIGASIIRSSAEIHSSRSQSRKSPGFLPPALLSRISGSGQASSAAARPASVVILAATV